MSKKRHESWKDVERRFLEGLPDKKKAWVKKNVNVELDNDVTQLSREKLIEMFPGRPEEEEGELRDTLNDKGLLMTFVWQIGMKIKAGDYTFIDGNLRTSWYKHVEPLYVNKDLLESDVAHPLSHDELERLVSPDVWALAKGRSEKSELLRAAIAGEVNVYRGMKRSEQVVYRRIARAARERYIVNTMTGAFGTFKLNGVFHYKDDFGFVDPRESYRIIGDNRPRVIFFTEKEGLWWLCKELSKKYKITVIASQGESSLLAMEFLVELLKKKKVRSVVVGALTDYDPWGFAIAMNFAIKLAADVFFGGGKVHLTRLNGSQADLKKLFTPEEIERGKRDLTNYSQYKQSQVEEWMKITDGIGGGKYGIHVDPAQRDRLMAVAESWIKDVSRNPGELITYDEE